MKPPDQHCCPSTRQIHINNEFHHMIIPGPTAQLEVSPNADPCVASSIPAQSHVS